MDADPKSPLQEGRSSAFHAASCYASSDGLVTLYLGDCRKLLPTIKADAIISDPPYGFGYDPSRNRKDQRTQKGLSMTDRNWKQIDGEAEAFDPRAMLCAPIVLLWGANHYADKLPSSKRWLIWDKRDGTPSDNQSDAELAWCNVGGSVRMHRQLWRGVARAGEENIASAGEKLHPHQKPVHLMAWCLDQAGVKPGMTVCDPYAGSASTLVACLRRGIKSIGIESDADHFKTAVERLEREMAQGDLFRHNSQDQEPGGFPESKCSG